MGIVIFAHVTYNWFSKHELSLLLFMMCLDVLEVRVMRCL